jgi:hypothetical protein
MQLAKLGLPLCVALSFGASNVCASPSRGLTDTDALSDVKSAFRAFAIDYQGLGPEVAQFDARLSSLSGSAALPQNTLLGSGAKLTLPARESVEAWGGNAEVIFTNRGNGGAQAEHDSLRVGIVPEPASLVAWTLIGSAFGVGAWKRRRRAV